MDVMNLPSDRLRSMHQRIRSAVHEGLHLSSEETVAFLDEVREAQSLLQDVENENWRLRHSLAARQDELRNRRSDFDRPDVRIGTTHIQARRGRYAD